MDWSLRELRFFVTAAETSYSIQVPAVTAAASPSFAEVRAGRLFQVNAASLQPVPVANTSGPSAVASTA